MELPLEKTGQTLGIEQVAEAIRTAILNGGIRPGQRLPSIRKLSASHGLSFHTVVGAYERLEVSGLISARPGRGFFVEATAAKPAATALHSLAGNDQSSLSAFWRLFHGNAASMKLGCGWLPSSWRDTQTLARVIRRTANFAHSTLVEYGDPSGHLPLRQHLSEHLEKRLGLALDPNQILTTLGATQALDLVIRKIIEPGDCVLVDDPCNSNLVQLLALRGAEVVGIARLPDGPDIERLEAVLATRPVRAFFINSQLHNPTGSSLSPQNAFQVLQLAYRYDVTLVEDDVYGDFSGDRNASLVTLDGLRKVIYISSFSKTLSASLRVGYLIGSPDLVASLADLKLLTSVAVPSFCERFLSAILADGTYERHLGLVQRKLQTSQAIAQAAFQSWGWEIFHAAKGGMFIWIRHPRLSDLDAFLERALQCGILLAPGNLFSADGRKSPWLRINVAHLDVEQAEPLFRL
ncbi:PLP-dependent aminotransferase family protein [Stutzerimonas nosocomialis]|uniref:PLP-dependent aminotransferase family protein n=1 Tax=Stutzerimonas nosocomialis TaxID=1056496 RepID=A0A5R9QE17_9GAMM|nr:PLP-dependent aminotransferase family protein [Stutzerimonas nosocomialis]TLX54083.1 PLP-dependent aminotransferase family protein [Stutzerimonas nosocomialis]TLX63387.1 PLP-dependent aminotransferase family protein [Stutzerimonas nosocomialis]